MAEFSADDLDLELGHASEIEVKTVGGQVAVTAGPGPLRVEGRVQRGQPLSVRLEHGVLRVVHELEAVLAGMVHKGPVCDVAVTAPPDAVVRIQTVSAEVVVAGFVGEVSVNTVSGGVCASGLRRGLTASVVSGALEAQGIDGDVTANAVSGDVTVIGGRLGAVAGRSVSGDLLLDVESIGETTLTTVSGAVAVRLPDDAALRFSASTMSGTLGSAFPLEARSQTRRHLTGAVNGGGPLLSVRSMSGDVSLLRKAVAPA